MAFDPSNAGAARQLASANLVVDEDGIPVALKILIAGGFGVGKTTLVGAVSEIQPLLTEEYLTDESVGVDDTSEVEQKATTTVAMDFGRITLNHDLVLYLFGTPGQDRFLFVWDELALGAIGAIVLADTRRLADCFPSVDYFESKNVPFIVAVNEFEGGQKFGLHEIAEALALPDDVPLIQVDARDRASAKRALVRITEFALTRLAVAQRQAVI